MFLEDPTPSQPEKNERTFCLWERWGQESRVLDGREAQPAGSHVWHSSFKVAAAFLSLLWNGFASNTEPKPEHPGGRQLHGSGSFLSGLCSGWMQLMASVMCLCQMVHFASLPTIFQLRWKGQSGGKDLAPHLGHWYMLIIAWLTKLRLWEKHQMFIRPEIKLHHLAVLLLASSVPGGEDTPRLLLLQFNVLKMTSPILSQIWTSHWNTLLSLVTPCQGKLAWSQQPSPGKKAGDRANTQSKVQGKISLMDICVHSDIHPARWKALCFSDTSSFGCSSLKFSHKKSQWKGLIVSTQNVHRWE